MKVQTGRSRDPAIFNGTFEAFLGDLYPVLRRKWIEWLRTTYSESSVSSCDTRVHHPQRRTNYACRKHLPVDSSPPHSRPALRVHSSHPRMGVNPTSIESGHPGDGPNQRRHVHLPNQRRRVHLPNQRQRVSQRVGLSTQPHGRRLRPLTDPRGRRLHPLTNPRGRRLHPLTDPHQHHRLWRHLPVQIRLYGKTSRMFKFHHTESDRSLRLMAWKPPTPVTT